MLFIQRGEFQQKRVIGRIEVRGFAIVRFRLTAAPLPGEGLPQPQLSRADAASTESSFERRCGPGELIRLEQRGTQIIDRPELLGFLLPGLLQERNRRCRVLGVDQRDRKVDLRFIESGCSSRVFRYSGMACASLPARL